MKKEGFIFTQLIPVLIDPLFCSLLKTDCIYANAECTKYSVKSINDDYNTYSGGLRKKFPGYKLDKQFLIKNDSDKELVLEELNSFLLSHDGDLYETQKDNFFGS